MTKKNKLSDLNELLKEDKDQLSELILGSIKGSQKEESKAGSSYRNSQKISDNIDFYDINEVDSAREESFSQYDQIMNDMGLGDNFPNDTPVPLKDLMKKEMPSNSMNMLNDQIKESNSKLFSNLNSYLDDVNS